MRPDVVEVTGGTRLPWADLYAAHAAEIAGYLGKLTGDRDAGTELMQETFVIGMRDEQALRDPGRARPWLYQIATHLAYKRLRRARIIAFLPFTGREAASAGAFDHDGHAVREALRAIPADQAIALVLRYSQGFSRAEIARLTGKSEETIKSRIARGRRAFLAAYEREGGRA